MDVDPADLKCNACWKSLLESQPSRSYKTPCGHIFCRPCAERRFSVTNMCSLCDASFDIENDLVELTHQRSTEISTAAFALAITYPEDAWRILVEASVFCRTQTALYGTREIFIRGKENETIKKKLVESENSLNAACMQLELKTKELDDKTSVFQQQGRTIEELRQQIKMLDSRLGNPPRGSGVGGSHSGSSSMPGGSAFGLGMHGAGGSTPKMGMHMAPTPRAMVDHAQGYAPMPSPSQFGRGGGGGGGGLSFNGGSSGGASVAGSSSSSHHSMGGGGGGGGGAAASVGSRSSSTFSVDGATGGTTGWQQQQQQQAFGGRGTGATPQQQQQQQQRGSMLAPAHGVQPPYPPQRGLSSAGRMAGPPLQQMTVGMPPRELATPALAGAQMMSRSGQAYTMAQQHHAGGPGDRGSGSGGRARMGMPGQGGGSAAGGGGGIVSGGFSTRM